MPVVFCFNAMGGSFGYPLMSPNLSGTHWCASSGGGSVSSEPESHQPGQKIAVVVVKTRFALRPHTGHVRSLSRSATRLFWVET